MFRDRKREGSTLVHRGSSDIMRHFFEPLKPAATNVLKRRFNLKSKFNCLSDDSLNSV